MTKKQVGYCQVLTKEEQLTRQKALREVLEIGKMVEALSQEENASDILRETAARGIYQNLCDGHCLKVQPVKKIKYNTAGTIAYLENSAGDTIARVNLETFCCELP